MMVKDTKSLVLINFFWRFAERCGAQGFAFIVTIILARLLTPDDYGTIALITVFINILQAFVDSGFANALIQKKDADEIDFSSVFFLNIILCTLLYIVMFFVAPLIASFYEKPELIAIIRILSVTLIISGVRNIQQAFVSKTMQFKRFFFSTIGGTIISAFVGIGMAFMGWGVWALVLHQLTNNAVGTIILWLTVKWRPVKKFSFTRLNILFAYGWKLLASSLLEKIYNETWHLVIGKVYTISDLAFFDRGRQFPNLIVQNINASIDSVLLPAMSACQDDKERVRFMTSRAIKISTFFMMPIMMLLAVCAVPVVRLILTEKWLPSVFFLRIFCFTFAFYPIHTANLNAIKALGRSDLFLKLEILKKILGLSALFATLFISIEAMAVSLLVTTVLSQIINSWPNRKLLNYRYLDQVKDMLPQISLSCIMGAIVFCVQYLDLNDWLTLLIQIPLGAAFYLFASRMLHIESFEYVLSVAKGYLK